MKQQNLEAFFNTYPRIALAFSGGVDSAYLLKAAVLHGAEVKAYMVKSFFQPEFEVTDARRLAAESGVDFEILQCNVLEDNKICENSPDRCYYCKKKIFSAILEAAAADGFSAIMDGTNASDDADERPGMRALGEMKVLSPLRLCGITKEEIRQKSREMGLFTWNKPAYACLATRIPVGEPITAEKLERIERAEEVLSSMGFTDFRVRLFCESARLQLPADQMENVLKKRREIRQKLKPYFETILLDLEERPWSNIR